MRVAVEEMVREQDRARRRTLERDRTTALIHLIDEMIEELEVLNLHDVTKVSEAWKGRLALLLASLPFEYAPRLNPYPWSPTEVLDMLFDVQGDLFALRTGQSARHPVDDSEAWAS